MRTYKTMSELQTLLTQDFTNEMKAKLLIREV